MLGPTETNNMDSSAYKQTLLTTLLRLAFWASWAGTAVLPILIFILNRLDWGGYFLEDKYWKTLFALGFTALVGLCFTSAWLVKPYPKLAYLGIMTVGIVLLALLLVTQFLSGPIRI
jgi:hypothetical protein